MRGISVKLNVLETLVKPMETVVVVIDPSAFYVK